MRPDDCCFADKVDVGVVQDVNGHGWTIMFFGHQVDVGGVEDASGLGRSTVFLWTSWLYVVSRM